METPYLRQKRKYSLYSPLVVKRTGSEVFRNRIKPKKTQNQLKCEEISVWGYGRYVVNGVSRLVKSLKGDRAKQLGQLDKHAVVGVSDEKEQHDLVTPLKRRKTDLVESKVDRFTPNAKVDIKFSKDPHHWNTSSSAKSRPVQYGTSFSRKRRSTKSANAEFLRMVYNGEKPVSESVLVERKKQLSKLHPGEDTSFTNSIIGLTERIREVLSGYKDDDLLITKEVKLAPPSKTVPFYSSKGLKFEASILTFQSDYENFKRILKERQELHRRVKEQRSQEVVPLVAPVTQQEQKSALSTWKRKDGHTVVMNKYNLQAKVADLWSLAPGTWLNDVIIEFQMARLEEELENVVAFNSYFYTSLESKGYAGVRRWMKRKKKQIDLLDKVFIPINVCSSHWTIAAALLKQKKIVFMDSLNNKPTPHTFGIMKRIQDYIVQESGGKLGEDFELDHMVSPTQPNGSDCGIYTCLNALCIGKEIEAKYTHKEAKDMRVAITNKMVQLGQE